MYKMYLAEGSNTNASFPDATVASFGLPIIALTSIFACLAFLKRTFGRFSSKGQTVQCTRISVLSTTESENAKMPSHIWGLRQFRDKYAEISADSFYRLSVEFEELKADGLCEVTIGDQGINRPKNRFVNIVPFDHSRVVLDVGVDAPPGSDYINANYITGYYASKEYIATQGPMKNTENDFWKMCWQENVHSIVMLTPCFDRDREKCVRYWPSSFAPEPYGEVEVEIVKETLESHNIAQQWILTDLIIRSQGQSREVRHYQFVTWPDFGAVEPPEALVHFIRRVRENAPYATCDSKPTPLAVHCSAGVGRSGTFIAVDILMQQIKNMQKIDIFGCVQRMRRERVWMVQTELQYSSVYKCAYAILKELAAQDKNYFKNLPGEDLDEILAKENLEKALEFNLDYQCEIIGARRLETLKSGVAKLTY